MGLALNSRMSFNIQVCEIPRLRDHARADGLSGEERLIARYFRPLATAPSAFGLGDDAAALTPPAGCDLVLTTDGVIAGVHFLPTDPPQSIARKALRMNLSDLAAKGAAPIGFLLSIALPTSTQEPWIAAFAEGLGQDIGHYGCPLLGGDTDRTPGPLSISITAFGTVPHDTMVRRARQANFCSSAICFHSHAMLWLRRFVPMHRRRWMYPMVSPGTWPSYAAPPGLRRSSTLPPCPCRMRRARRFPPMPS